MDRDLNSAINILNWGINEINTAGTAEIYACGDISVGDILEDSSLDSYNISSHVSLKHEIISSLEEAACSLDAR